MDKIKLYLDFDGVILDTMNVAKNMLEEFYVGDDQNIIRKFFKDLDWYELLRITDEINNSFDNINKLVVSNLFDIEILTHVNSLKEGQEKINYLNEKLPGVNVIITPIDIAKCDKVNPLNAVLVDDYSKNLLLWQEKGGIAIKFSLKDKQYDFITISSLEQILDIYEPIKKQIKVKNKILKL